MFKRRNHDFWPLERLRVNKNKTCVGNFREIKTEKLKMSSTRFTKYEATVYVWSSSHLKDHRFLPFWIKMNFKHSLFENSPILIAESGERISSGIGHVISSKAIEVFPLPQIHFVILGDNDMY